MQTLTEFKASLNASEPDPSLSVLLKSLWYDAKGDWHHATAKSLLIGQRCGVKIRIYPTSQSIYL
jgi:hypothetical protein